MFSQILKMLKYYYDSFVFVDWLFTPVCCVAIERNQSMRGM